MSEALQVSPITTTGQRLSHLLDVIGFPSGHGRVNCFHNHLKTNCPHKFGDISYSTVRAWFGNNSPPLEKLIEVLTCIDKSFSIPIEVGLAASWIKAGGINPLESGVVATDKTIEEDIDFKRIGQTYIKVLSVAEKLGVNIEGLENNPSNKITKSVLEFMSTHPDASDEDVAKVIESMIYLAQKKLL